MPNISETERDKLSPVWDMSQERAFMEQLMNQRINFFLITFALIVAGTANAKTQILLQFILSFGTILCLLLSISIYRSTTKVAEIFRYIKKDATHPLTIIDKAVGGFSVRGILGYLLPTLCTLFLLALCLLSFCGKLAVPAK